MITKTHKLKVREWFREYKKSLSCYYCCSNKELTFHHVHPETKIANVSDLVTHGCSWSKVMAEADKCIVLCISCHRRHETMIGRSKTRVRA